MKSKLIYEQSNIKIDEGLSIWKGLYDEKHKRIYAEYNVSKRITIHI